MFNTTNDITLESGLMRNMNRATLSKKPAEIAGMFDDVARNYDLTNTILTGGLVHGWRKITTEALNITPQMRVLDLAAGTGTSAVEYYRAGAQVVATDFSSGMIAQGKKRYPFLTFEQADATNLPYADNYFDAVTISYGLRNIAAQSKALQEMWRVTKPGGTLLVCEFSKPVNRAFGQLYRWFLQHGMPVISHVFSSDAPAYDYLAESILDWPDQVTLAGNIAKAGWVEVEYKNLTNGLVALHRARKPL